MGWAYGRDGSRPFGDQEVGYGVPATCEHPGCNEEIDRGLAYACGEQPYEGENYCNKFFCYSHLYWSPDDPEAGRIGFRCAECCGIAIDDEQPE